VIIGNTSPVSSAARTSAVAVAYVRRTIGAALREHGWTTAS